MVLSSANFENPVHPACKLKPLMSPCYFGNGGH